MKNSSNIGNRKKENSVLLQSDEQQNTT